MLAEMTGVARDLGTLAERVARLLDDEKLAAFGNTLVNVEQLTGMLASRADAITDNSERIDTILANKATMSKELPAVVDAMSKLIVTVEGTVMSIDGTATTVTGAVARSERRFERATGELLNEVGPLLVEMRALGVTLERTVRALEREPESLLFGRDRGRLGPGEEKR